MNMYYIGHDVHKKPISYCVKDLGGLIQQQGTFPRLAHSWIEHFRSGGRWHWNNDLHGLGLRSSASTCCTGEGSASCDAACDRSGEEKERSHRYRQDRGLPVL